MGKIYTTQEAAKELGLEVSHVRRLLEQGKIKGRKWGRDWQVLSLDYKRQKAPRVHRGKAEDGGKVR
jgi:excisionase family DNA binding protein